MTITVYNWHYTQHASTSICHTYTSRGWGFHLGSPPWPIDAFSATAASAFKSNLDVSKFKCHPQMEQLKGWKCNLSIVGNKTCPRLAQKLWADSCEDCRCQTFSCCSKIHVHQRKVFRIPKGKFANDTVYTHKLEEYLHVLAIRSVVWSEDFFIEPFHPTWNVLKFKLTLNHVSFISHSRKNLSSAPTQR